MLMQKAFRDVASKHCYLYWQSKKLDNSLMAFHIANIVSYAITNTYTQMQLLVAEILNYYTLEPIIFKKDYFSLINSISNAKFVHGTLIVMLPSSATLVRMLGKDKLVFIK